MRLLINFGYSLQIREQEICNNLKIMKIKIGILLIPAIVAIVFGGVVKDSKIPLIPNRTNFISFANGAVDPSGNPRIYNKDLSFRFRNLPQWLSWSEESCTLVGMPPSPGQWVIQAEYQQRSNPLNFGFQRLILVDSDDQNRFGNFGGLGSADSQFVFIIGSSLSGNNLVPADSSFIVLLPASVNQGVNSNGGSQFVGGSSGQTLQLSGGQANSAGSFSVVNNNNARVETVRNSNITVNTISKINQGGLFSQPKPVVTQNTISSQINRQKADIKIQPANKPIVALPYQTAQINKQSQVIKPIQNPKPAQLTSKITKSSQNINLKLTKTSQQVKRVNTQQNNFSQAFNLKLNTNQNTSIQNPKPTITSNQITRVSQLNTKTTFSKTSFQFQTTRSQTSNILKPSPTLQLNTFTSFQTVPKITQNTIQQNNLVRQDSNICIALQRDISNLKTSIDQQKNNIAVLSSKLNVKPAVSESSKNINQLDQKVIELMKKIEELNRKVQSGRAAVSAIQSAKGQAEQRSSDLQRRLKDAADRQTKARIEYENANKAVNDAQNAIAKQQTDNSNFVKQSATAQQTLKSDEQSLSELTNLLNFAQKNIQMIKSQIQSQNQANTAASANLSQQVSQSKQKLLSFQDILNKKQADLLRCKSSQTVSLNKQSTHRECPILQAVQGKGFLGMRFEGGFWISGEMVYVNQCTRIKTQELKQFDQIRYEIYSLNGKKYIKKIERI